MFSPNSVGSGEAADPAFETDSDDSDSRVYNDADDFKERAGLKNILRVPGDLYRKCMGNPAFKKFIGRTILLVAGGAIGATVMGGIKDQKYKERGPASPATETTTDAFEEADDPLSDLNAALGNSDDQTSVGVSAEELNNLLPDADASEGAGTKVTPEEINNLGQDQENAAPEYKELTGNALLDQAIDGSFSQYDNLGCYSDDPESKVTLNSIGNPDKVLEAMGINPAEATAEQRGTVQEYFAYSMDIVSAPIATIAGFEGFDGLTQREAEDKIRAMTPEEKTDFQQRLKEFFGNTSYRYLTGSGVSRNEYAYDEEGGTIRGDYQESDLTGISIVEGTTTLEDGTTTVWTFKPDCGNLEIFATRSDGTKIVIIVRPPSEPETPKEPDTPEPEWGKSGDPHSGENRKPSESVKPSSQTTQQQNNNTNKGNQGGTQSKPGSSSSNKGNNKGSSQGSNNGNNQERAKGGADQSGGNKAGNNNSAPKGNPNVDNAGNKKQQEAQKTAKPGGNNNSDKAEEARVSSGDF